MDLRRWASIPVIVDSNPTTSAKKDKIMTNVKKKYLAKTLAGMFPENIPTGPCACVGTECTQLGCNLFWEMFLSDPNHIRKALELYIKAKEIMKE